MIKCLGRVSVMFLMHDHFQLVLLHGYNILVYSCWHSSLSKKCNETRFSKSVQVMASAYILRTSPCYFPGRSSLFCKISRKCGTNDKLYDLLKHVQFILNQSRIAIEILSL